MWFQKKNEESVQLPLIEEYPEIVLWERGDCLLIDHFAEPRFFHGITEDERIVMSDKNENMTSFRLLQKIGAYTIRFYGGYCGVDVRNQTFQNRHLKMLAENSRIMDQIQEIRKLLGHS